MNCPLCSRPVRTDLGFKIKLAWCGSSYCINASVGEGETKQAAEKDFSEKSHKFYTIPITSK